MKQKKKKNTTQEKKNKEEEQEQEQNEKAENKIEDIKNKEDDEITTEINKYNKQKINMIEQNNDDAKKNLSNLLSLYNSSEDEAEEQVNNEYNDQKEKGKRNSKNNQQDDQTCDDKICDDKICDDKICDDKICDDKICDDKICDDKICDDNNNEDTYQNNESKSIIKSNKNIKDKQIGCKQNTSYNICTTNNINNEIHKYPQKQYNHIYTNQSNISHNIHNTYYSQNAYQNENYYYQYLNYPHVANFNMMMNTTNPVLYNNNNIYDKSKKNNFNNLGFSKNKEMNIDINQIPVVDQREILREWKPNIIKEEKKSQKYTIKTKVYNPVNNTFDKAIIHGKNQKRKHQINWLAKEAVEKEYEILQKTNNNKRRTTSDKYGW
ncbi:conserved Plasmodium protein, unknown function [Plasmodium sp. gorilla clade G1]|nr:conserved Plasmodium protein, unknown function [Plasmodium sp. gorilla clade G1]